MGTSSSYSGPRGRMPLLPPWADDDPGFGGVGEEGGQPPAERPTPPPPRTPPPGDWSRPRAAIRQIARSGRTTRPSLRGLGRSYTRAAGGASTAARAATGGRRSTAGLTGFLSDAVRGGVATALERRGLAHLLGQDVVSVLATLADYLAPSGASLEEAAARISLTETLNQVFSQYEVDDKGLQALEQMTEKDLGVVVELSVSNYIAERLLQQLVIEVEKASLSEEDANRVMNEVRDFITEIVKLDLEDGAILEVDWSGAQGQSLMRRWFEEGYRLFGS